MKKFLKISFFILLIIALLLLSVGIYLIAITKDVKLDENKLVNLDKTIIFYNKNDEIISEKSGNTSVTDLKDMPKYVKNAFIAIEDKRFYSHNGIDFRGLMRAAVKNVTSFSFKEGASTISQQLIKNTHLSSDKTLKRKISEMKLALELERKYSKDQIIETYLNTIYFGENCFGITKASKKYFSKSPAQLTVNESAILAGLVKAPSYYSPISNAEKCYSRKNVVLKEMFNQGYISKSDYEAYKAEGIRLNVQNENVYDYVYLAKKEISKYIENYKLVSNNLRVYTNLDVEMQRKINESIKNSENSCNKSVIITDKKSNVLAYSSTCGEVNRSMGSTIKPLLVYAPAIETNTVCSCTQIVDEKTNFNGYSPSNFNEKYYGKVDVKTSLAKSLNVCAVKILNYTGIEKSLNYVKKTNIPITTNDAGLSLALGATEKGATLSQIASAYTVFNNNGYFNPCTCIRKIQDENGRTLYINDKLERKVFSEDTVEILNDMMRETVISGTAKKLGFNDYALYAKTGTVGNEYGNTDAYSISYSSDYVIGYWLGESNTGKLNNNVTGGSLPTQYSAEIWSDIYKNSKPEPIPMNSTVEIDLDAISYEENRLELADEFAPERYKIKGLFKKSYTPKTKSNRFIKPKVDNANLSVNSRGILIDLRLTQLYDAKIYRTENGRKVCVYDTKINGKSNEILDTDIVAGKTYSYSIVPYYQNQDRIFYGAEYFLPTVKTPRINLGDRWWMNEFS